MRTKRTIYFQCALHSHILSGVGKSKFQEKPRNIGAKTEKKSRKIWGKSCFGILFEEIWSGKVEQIVQNLEKFL